MAWRTWSAACLKCAQASSGTATRKQSVLNCMGECLLGFCRCERGFFGLDCGLSVDAATGQPYVWVTNHSLPAMAYKPRPTF